MTTLPVFLTDERTVSRSSGRSVRRSMTSALMPSVGDQLGGLQAVVGHEAVGQDRDVVAGARHLGPPERHHVVRVGHLATHRAIELLVLEEEDRVGVADAAAQQAASVVRRRGHDDLEAGHVGEEGLDRLAVVEGAVDAAAVWRSDGDGTAEGAVGAIAQARRLADDLVEGRKDEVGELDLRHRPQPVDRRPDRGPDDERLGERRIDDALAAEFAEEPVGGQEDAALPADVLAQDDHRLVASHLVGERLADGLDQGPDGHRDVSPRARSRRGARPWRDRARAGPRPSRWRPRPPP